MLTKTMTKWNLLAALVFGTSFWACSGDKTAGTDEQSEGLYAIKNLDIAGVSQKGPFVKGSAVTVQGIDCKTMEFTDEVFEGEVKNNMGEFVVEKVNLSTTCAVVEVTGEYRSEMTGKKVSDKMTLRALTNLKDRTHVNVNLLTNLEYERVMYYVTEKGKTFDEAKELAENEVLTAFGMAGKSTEFENLDIFGTSDADATLLAISVLMQGDADVKTLTERLDKFNESFAESGKWNDDDTKNAITDWIANAVAKAVMDSIRKNMENWGFANEVPDFETAVDAFATNVSKEKNSDSVKTDGWSWDVSKEARFNPNIKYDSIIDPRDKQVYKVVKIEVKEHDYSQVWMAENLNYADSVKTPSLKGQNWCYNNDEKNCKVSGRYYTWAAAIDSVALANDSKNPLNCGYGKTCEINRGVQGICPDGWHLPTLHEWGLLSVALGNAGVAGDSLKALTGWDYAGTADNNGVDAYGFAALPTGRMVSTSSWSNVGSNVYYWSSEEDGTYEARYSNINNIYTKFYLFQGSKKYGQSVRCIKGDPSTAAIKSSSSSSVDDTKSSSSKIATAEWSWDVPKEDRFNPNIEYDTMIDPRDKQVYKIVRIAPEGTDYSQVWMAENLNYADTVQMPILKNQSWCYLDSAKNCKVSGRYYTWMAAIDSASLATDKTDPLVCGYGKECGLARPVQGVCPDGWHLPTRHELGKLIIALGNSEIAGRNLKSLSGWGSSAEGSGVDAYGFTALPVGRRLSSGSYQKVSTDNYFWSTSEYTEDEAEYMNMNNIYTKAYMYRGSKYNGQNVRCVKGEPIVEGWSWDVPKDARLNPNIKYDSMVDLRDKQVYKIVKIEVKDKDYSQVWMAENLNYADSVKTPSLKGRNWCYNDDEKNCKVSGRYYSWAAAIDSVALVNDLEEPLDCGSGKTCGLDRAVQGICPDGWHLPTIDEWGQLSVALGNADVSGAALKALSGWDYAGTVNNNGTDKYGFAALPTGRRISATQWEKVGSDVYYWSSTEENSADGRYSNINNLYAKFYIYQNYKHYGQSVRCVKDE
ncbi:fibrobacter succinogenes major paralogous domain-containing protein [Fibrobacter sp. UWB7]|uniref:fibrobacter succinogenes major paralogous domain-containing protein n=1 Tax=Fibrobacter sp. UWB7 TaxID=1896206 RepID=UPI000915E610|nr:fibrobacter succinogenes major paralogous domain-containing protein [Fibrobacter sp. UWB7]SHM88936.1 major paralogous domain-containing protein [Fibrobacter sp. UWB7]